MARAKRTNQIKFSKDLEWFRDMIMSASDLVPLHRLGAIVSRKSPSGKIQRTFAMIRQKGRKFEITLRPMVFEKKYVRTGIFTQGKSVSRDYGPLLDDLAHELAHMVEWEHSLEHMELTAKIVGRFAKWHRDNGVEMKDYYKFKPGGES